MSLSLKEMMLWMVSTPSSSIAPLTAFSSFNARRVSNTNSSAFLSSTAWSVSHAHQFQTWSVEVFSLVCNFGCLLCLNGWRHSIEVSMRSKVCQSFFLNMFSSLSNSEYLLDGDKLIRGVKFWDFSSVLDQCCCLHLLWRHVQCWGKSS